MDIATSYSMFNILLSVHYDDVIMTTIASQITSLTIVYSTVYSDADQRKHQSSASLAFVRGIHRGPGNSPHKWPVTRKMFPFDDVIMHRMVIGFISLFQFDPDDDNGHNTTLGRFPWPDVPTNQITITMECRILNWFSPGRCCNK